MNQFSTEELRAFISGLGETLEAIEDWEFQTRTGFTKDEFRVLLAKTKKLMRASDDENNVNKEGGGN